MTLRRSPSSCSTWRTDFARVERRVSACRAQAQGHAWSGLAGEGQGVVLTAEAWNFERAAAAGVDERGS